MLNVVTPSKALEIIKENFSYPLKTESLSVLSAAGRILAEDITADEDIPPFDRTTVDGYAVNARDTYGASENMPAMLKLAGEVLMGEEAGRLPERGSCIKISTGGMMPENSDAAVMVEYTDETFDGMCLCNKSVSPGENVTKRGDDVKKGQRVLERGQRISSSAVGVLAALGKTDISCVKKPVAGIISTGDEIVSASETPAFGKIRDINSVLLCALMQENGCDVISFGIVRDNKDELRSMLEKALSRCDIVLLSGGSSKGARDMTAEIISEKGELLFHGLAMKPGKPTILGKCEKRAVFGLPGHPAAAYFSALRVVLPLIRNITGEKNRVRSGKYILGTDIPSNHGREELIPVRTDGNICYPVYGKSGLVSLLSESDGYIIIDRNREGAYLGEETEVYFTR